MTYRRILEARPEVLVVDLNVGTAEMLQLTLRITSEIDQKVAVVGVRELEQIVERAGAARPNAPPAPPRETGRPPLARLARCLRP